MNHRKRLLIADNSQHYRRSVRVFLELEGYVVEEAAGVEETEEKLELKEFDLLVVGLRMRNDVDQNDMSGLEVAKFAFELGIPCIILTAFPSVEVARMALQSNRAEPLAKDLVTKASGPMALLDSISMTLRNEESKYSKPKARGLSIDFGKGLVTINGKLIELTKNQYILLGELYKRGGGILSWAELVKMIYGEEIGEKIAQRDPRLLNIVAGIKQKIERKGSRHELLETVQGSGYRLNPRLLSTYSADTAPGNSTDFISIEQSERLAKAELSYRRPLHVFLCHSSADKPIVKKLYSELIQYIWIDPWLDDKKILPGDDWDLEIKQAVRTSDIVLVCLSQGSLTKEGYVQKEIKQALDVADEKPDGTTYVIPIKLEPCDVPERLLKWHWLNYYEEDSHRKLLLSLRKRALLLNIETE